MLISWASQQPAFRFSPLSLFAASEPGVWYDPSDLSTMFQDSTGTTPVTAAGQSVGLVLDKSGRGNHATQSTSLSRPTYQVDGNGRGYLLFDGSDDFLVTPTITPGTDKAQVFAGVRKLSDAAVGIVAELSTNAGTGNAGSFYVAAPESTGASSDYRFKSSGSLFPSSVTSGPILSPNTSVVTGIGDISGDNRLIRINGVQLGVATTDQGTGNYLAYPAYIGRRGGTSLPFNGRIYSLICRFGPNLTADQIAQTEAWVNSKTGAY